MPGRMHELQILPLEDDRQTRQEPSECRALRRRQRLRIEEIVLGIVMIDVEVLPIPLLDGLPKQIQLMITQQALRQPAGHQARHKPKQRRAIRPPIRKFLDEDQASAGWMSSIPPVCQDTHELPTRVDLAVNVCSLQP